VSDTIITQTLPCPSCGHLIKPDVGLKIPSLPEAVTWACEACSQPLVLTLVRDKGGAWEVRAYRMTPTVRCDRCRRPGCQRVQAKRAFDESVEAMAAKLPPRTPFIVDVNLKLAALNAKIECDRAAKVRAAEVPHAG
jgi:hypothetical protein